MIGQQHQRPFQQRSNAHRKNGTDKSTSPFFCDPCDQGFYNENQYTTHLSQHIKCHKRNCSFSACARVMKLHKLKCGSKAPYMVESPEEIANYLKERAKHFPTKENIEKKERDKLEKIAEMKRLNEQKERNQEEDCEDNQPKKGATRFQRSGKFRGGRLQRGGFQRQGKKKFSQRDNHCDQKRRTGGNFYLKATPLLNKLLPNEMEEEQDIILECLSYFVKNNFFLCSSQHTTQEQVMENNSEFPESDQTPNQNRREEEKKVTDELVHT